MKHIVITLNITITDDGDINTNNTSYKPYIWPRTGMYYPLRPTKSAWSSYLEALPVASKQKKEAAKVIQFPTCKLLEGSK
jgi:hypothetical protein